jgi:hypothetical protein
MRHDWNSLLSDDDELLVTKYSDLYFPPADTFVDYLRDYHKKLGLNVKFDTDISELAYHIKSKNDMCRFTMRDQRKSLICCKHVFVAIGFEKPLIPTHVVGHEYMEGYEDISINPKDYEGQSVLILGRGNSGLETAMAIYGSTNFVHLVGRSRIKFSWDTHYVGDVRGLNNEVFDSYHLKSLDGIFEADTADMYIVKRESDGKLMLRSATITDINFLDQNPVRDGYDRIIRCLGFKWDDSLFSNCTKPGSSTLPKVTPNKYPSIGYDYQSPVYPGLYFLGTLAHSIDFRKSAGGFVHGFRYAIRAMHRMVEWRNHGVKWPSITKDLDQLVPSILKRANEASGIYQMFSHLGDLAIVDRKTNTFVYVEEFPLNLLPNVLKYTGYHLDPTRHSLFVLSLEYGKNFSIAGADHFGLDRAVGTVDRAHKSNFLHPVIYFYRDRAPTEEEFKNRAADETLPKPDGIHHILEDFTTQFDGPTTHILPFRRFVEHHLGLDLRTFTAETCIAMTLSIKYDSLTDLPHGCRRYLSSQASVLMYM